jgi:hypothetical protein
MSKNNPTPIELLREIIEREDQKAKEIAQTDAIRTREILSQPPVKK